MTTSLPPVLFDELPPRLSHQQRVMHRMGNTLAQFGYTAVTTPLVEQADLFLIKAGDAAINRLVSFDLAGQTLCLRPEFTAPAARAYIEHFQSQQGPVRLQFSGPILQYENLRHGEITQRQAIGAEHINNPDATADAEIIALTSKALEQADVTAWSLVIGHSGLINRFLDRYGLNRQMRRFVLDMLPTLRDNNTSIEQIEAMLDAQLAGAIANAQPSVSISPDSEMALQALMSATPQRGPSGGRTREEIARRLLEKQTHSDHRNNALQAINDLRQVIEHAETPEELHQYLHSDPLEPLAASIVDTFLLLQAYGIPEEQVTFDLTFTRDLDYYTGIVFEFRTPSTTGSRLLGGGGRYDELIGLLGAEQHIPAVGFMLYTDAILAEADAYNQQPNTSKYSLIVTSQHANLRVAAIQLANELRAAGLAVATQLSGSVQPTQNTIVATLREDRTIQVEGPGAHTTTIPSISTQKLIELLENYS